MLSPLPWLKVPLHQYMKLERWTQVSLRNRRHREKCLSLRILFITATGLALQPQSSLWPSRHPRCSNADWLAKHSTKVEGVEGAVRLVSDVYYEKSLLRYSFLAASSPSEARFPLRLFCGIQIKLFSPALEYKFCSWTTPEAAEASSRCFTSMMKSNRSRDSGNLPAGQELGSWLSVLAAPNLLSTALLSHAQESLQEDMTSTCPWKSWRPPLYSECLHSSSQLLEAYKTPRGRCYASRMPSSAIL